MGIMGTASYQGVASAGAEFAHASKCTRQKADHRGHRGTQGRVMGIIGTASYQGVAFSHAEMASASDNVPFRRGNQASNLAAGLKALP